MKVLLASLAAGAVALPSPVEAPAAATAPDLTIRSVTLNPVSPVVGPVGTVRLVVEVVARGVAGPEGVTIQVEPGVPPESSRVGTFPVSASGSVSASVPGAVPAPRPTRVPSQVSGTRKGTVARLAGGPGAFLPGSGYTGFPGVDGGPIMSGHGSDGADLVTSAHGSDGADLVTSAHGSDGADLVTSAHGSDGADLVTSAHGSDGADLVTSAHASDGAGLVTSGQGSDGAGLIMSGHGSGDARLITSGQGGIALETAKVSSRAGQDWETWRFAPDKSLSRWYPAGRWTVTATAKGAGGTTVTGYAPFWLKRETRFGAVQAVRKGTEVQVDGVLKRVDPRGVVDYAPFAGQPVEILHRETAQAAWTPVATATSDAQGKFSRIVPDRQGGEWRIRFAGTGHYAARLGKIHPTSPSAS
ncbi:hypothetical protein [Streptosporangium subroseum]|uniref:hypothetical protein n=1 Tax=Streptosporangium subroseum TaxID=106412 RepID=UPI003088104A|nr:hypothetical protein OHB15_30185 [Streptosporangium subroseum]